jgi:hypothetical protein
MAKPKDKKAANKAKQTKMDKAKDDKSKASTKTVDEPKKNERKMEH